MGDDPDQSSLSIVIPVYRGAKTIGPLVESLGLELAEFHKLEVVLVDDGSPDESARVCTELAERLPWVRFVKLARNFGEHSAVLAGLHHTSAECVVIMDDDFQNPPSEVRRLVGSIEEGFDVVYGHYARKRHGVIRNLGSRFTGWVATRALGKPKDLYLSSFKAMNRFVVDQLCLVSDPFPYIDGYIFRITHNLTQVQVDHQPRREGESGYTMTKLVGLWLNLVTNFSLAPLRLASVLGLVVAIVGVIAGAAFSIERLRNPDLPLGWASVIVSVTVLAGVQLFALGMIGEYLGRLVHKLSGAPQFVVRSTVNCPPSPETGES